MTAGRRYELGLRKFVRLAWETALGCACGCVLLLPAGLSLLQNPRTIDPFSGYGYLFYGKSQQYGAIFYSTLLMPDAPYFKDLFQEGILKHTSLTAYLPLVGVAGGLAFCRARERHPFTYVLKVCVACAFVPVLNSAFYALNSSYYARWYYMPILVLCGATCYLLSRPALAEQRLRLAVQDVLFGGLDTRRRVSHGREIARDRRIQRTLGVGAHVTLGVLFALGRGDGRLVDDDRAAVGFRGVQDRALVARVGVERRRGDELRIRHAHAQQGEHDEDDDDDLGLGDLFDEGTGGAREDTPTSAQPTRIGQFDIKNYEKKSLTGKLEGAILSDHVKANTGDTIKLTVNPAAFIQHP